MADEKEKENNDSIEGEDVGKNSNDSLLPGFDFQKILLTSLQYIVVAVLTFIISYCVSSRNKESVYSPQQFNAKMSEEELRNTDINTDDFYTPIPSGFDWTMEEMIINTADEDANHFVKAKIVVSYDKEKPAILTELTARSSQLHAEVRKIIGSKRYSDIRGIHNQEILTKEIKTKVQLIVRKPGVIDVFLRDFTLH